MIRWPALFLPMLASLAACTPAAPDPADGERTARIELFRNELRQVTTVERDVRLDAMERRIAALEREVGVLKETPERIDLDLLTQRMTNLEARSLAAAPVAAAPAPAPASVVDTRKADAEVRAAIQRKRPQPKPSPSS